MSSVSVLEGGPQLRMGPATIACESGVQGQSLAIGLHLHSNSLSGPLPAPSRPIVAWGTTLFVTCYIINTYTTSRGGHPNPKTHQVVTL